MPSADQEEVKIHQVGTKRTHAAQDSYCVWKQGVALTGFCATNSTGHAGT